MAQAKKALAKKTKKARAEKRAQTYLNYIDGRWVPTSGGGEWIENRNPADTRDVIGRFPHSTEADTDEAIAAAERAFNGWRLMPAPRRAEILFRVGEILMRDKAKYTRDM